MDNALEFAVHCAMESGKIQKQYFQKKIGIHHKGEINLVTDVDLACQHRIIELLEESFPDDYIIAEEKPNSFDGGKNKWIVDPLDGTTNYAHGYPFFCTSIAYEVSGRVTAGVVYNPIFNELFFAQEGEGAYLNGERIKVSGIDDMKQGLLCTGFPYDLATTKKNNINHFVNFLFHAQAVRRDGSAAMNLSYVACGRFDGYWEMKLNPWDMAAGALMVTEAGGMITDFSGKAFSIYGDELVASNGIIHGNMLEVLKEGR
ncbi:MAG: Inositol-1-monophosphatase [Syntrophorhabdus sp. PtaU1.Bin050]|nr:MAG: Inositol-1-monophosphatase [Syntrophorhabdus sp. PtaU1.Bin050]